MGFKGTDPPGTQKNLGVTLQSALHIHTSASAIQPTSGRVVYYVFTGKKSTYKWNGAVKSCVVQGSAVNRINKICLKVLLLTFSTFLYYQKFLNLIV